MKCPACVKDGKTSKLWVGPASILGREPVQEHPPVPPDAMGLNPFFDEKGVLKVHDPTLQERQMVCTNGHELRWRGTASGFVGDDFGDPEQWWLIVEDDRGPAAIEIDAKGKPVPKPAAAKKA